MNPLNLPLELEWQENTDRMMRLKDCIEMFSKPKTNQDEIERLKYELKYQKLVNRQHEIDLIINNYDQSTH